MNVGVCACTASWTKQVSLCPNWCVFQEGWGGPVSCQETKFGCRSCYTDLCVSCLSIFPSVHQPGAVSLFATIGYPFEEVFFIEKVFFLLILIPFQAPKFPAVIAGVGALWLSGCSGWFWRSSAPHCCFLQWCPLCILRQVWVFSDILHLFFLFYDHLSVF